MSGDARRDYERRHGVDPGTDLYRIDAAAGYRQDVEAASLADAVAAYLDRVCLPADRVRVTYSDGTAVVWRARHVLATITAL